MSRFLIFERFSQKVRRIQSLLIGGNVASAQEHYAPVHPRDTHSGQYAYKARRKGMFSSAKALVSSGLTGK